MDDVTTKIKTFCGFECGVAYCEQDVVFESDSICQMLLASAW